LLPLGQLSHSSEESWNEDNLIQYLHAILKERLSKVAIEDFGVQENDPTIRYSWFLKCNLTQTILRDESILI